MLSLYYLTVTPMLQLGEQRIREQRSGQPCTAGEPRALDKTSTTNLSLPVWPEASHSTLQASVSSPLKWEQLCQSQVRVRIK